MVTSLLHASVALVLCVGAGYVLEELASQQRFGLHLVPLGANGGADVHHISAHPSPFGEHGWLVVPLGAFDMMLLLLDGAAVWRSPESWWGRCKGAVWGQLRTLVVCGLSILPTVLAAWLLWMPWRCTPLTCVTAGLTASLSFTSLLFWADMLPVLPRARADAATSRAGVRRALLNLLHVTCLVLAGAAGQLGSTAELSEECVALGARAAGARDDFVGELMREMAAQTPQGSMSASSLVLQLLCACLAIHVVVDSPQRQSDGALWGDMD